MVHTKYSGLDTLGSPLQLIIPSVRMFNSIWFLLFSSPKQFLTDRKHRFLFESCLQNKRAQNIIRWRSQKFGQGEKRQQYGKIRKTREAAKNYVLSGFIWRTVFLALFWYIFGHFCSILSPVWSLVNLLQWEKKHFSPCKWNFSKVKWADCR